jgi:DNA (cytosine-5)-methyltransferase 1
MRVLDLFAGAGGLSEGFYKEGYNVFCKIEKNKSACETLLTRSCYYHLKDTEDFVKYKYYIQGLIDKSTLIEYAQKHGLNKNSIINLEIGENTIHNALTQVKELLKKEKLDGIIGGPPCQAYSLIGRSSNSKKKEFDERIYLYEYYVKFLEELKPKFFIFENVKGLLSYKDKNKELLLPQIIKAFEKCGYKVSYTVLDASKFGVPQKRERVFIFGIKTKRKYSFFEEFTNEYSNDCLITINELFLDLPKIKAGQSSNQYLSNIESKSNYLKDSLIRTDGWNVLTQHISRPNNANDLMIYKLVSEEKEKGVNVLYSDLPKNLIKHNNTEAFLDRFKAIDGKSISHTIVAHIAKDGHHYIHPDSKQNRSISIREAARIQSFPDDYFFETSRTAAFTQIGNAVPPLLAKKLAHKIKSIVK